MRIAAQEDEIKKQYWDMFKKKYLNNTLMQDPVIMRKIRIIRERGINVQMPQSKVTCFSHNILMLLHNTVDSRHGTGSKTSTTTEFCTL